MKSLLGSEGWERREGRPIRLAAALSAASSAQRQAVPSWQKPQDSRERLVWVGVGREKVEEWVERRGGRWVVKSISRGSCLVSQEVWVSCRSRLGEW